MQYAILLYEKESDFAAREDEQRKGSYWGGWRAYGEALRQADQNKAGIALQGPHTGTTLRVNEGARRCRAAAKWRTQRAGPGAPMEYDGSVTRAVYARCKLALSKMDNTAV
jgi:hypothetical protein